MSEQKNPFEDMFGHWAKLWAGIGEKDGLLGLAMQAWDPRQWGGGAWTSVEGPIESLLGLPRFAIPPIDRKLLALLGGWVVLAQRSGEYGAKSTHAWSEAYTEFQAELNREAAQGKPIHAGRELLDRWVAVLGRKMQVVQKSEEFLECQNRLMEALLNSRSREREIIEMIAGALDLPTRSELNDAHRSIHDLKREVRALRRELDAAAKPDNEKSPPPAKTGRSKRDARSTRPARVKGEGNGTSHPD
jgi:polyhydroxyalkanoate synthase subunit PhaE